MAQGEFKVGERRLGRGGDQSIVVKLLGEISSWVPPGREGEQKLGRRELVAWTWHCGEQRLLAFFLGLGAGNACHVLRI
jgi:hypothetical protein